MGEIVVFEETNSSEDDNWENAIEQHACRIDQIIQTKEGRRKRECESSVGEQQKRQKIEDNFMTDDVLRLVFSHLEGQQLGLLASVCSQWRRVIKSSNNLWHSLYLQRWRLTNEVLANELMVDILAGRLNSLDYSRTCSWLSRYGLRHYAENNFESSQFRTFTTEAHSGAVCSLRLRKDVVVTGGEDKMVKLWSLKSLTQATPPNNQQEQQQQEQQQHKKLSEEQKPSVNHIGSNSVPFVIFQAHKEAVWSVDVADTFVVSGSGDCLIYLWPFKMEDISNSVTQLPDCNNQRPFKVLRGHTAEVWSVQISEGRILSASVDGYVKLWDVNTGVVLKTISHVTAGSRAPRPFKNDLCASVFDCNIQGNRVLTAGGDNRLLEWDIRTPSTAVREYLGHEEAVFSIAAEHSILATGSGDATVKIWDPTTGKSIQDLPHNHAVWSCVTDGNVRMASAGIDSRVQMWSLKSGEASTVGCFVGHVGSVFELGMNDYFLVSGGADGEICCMDFVNGNCDGIL